MNPQAAESYIQEFLNGTAPESEVNEFVFFHIADTSLRMTKHQLGGISNMSALEAVSALDHIDEGCQQLKDIQQWVSKYPYAYAAIEAYLSVLFYAKSTLVPCYLMTNRDALLRKDGVKSSTYIIKNPLTNLIKIGRAHDVDARIKSLQTGSGVKLVTLVVITDDIELEIHQRFADKRCYGEWFEDDDGAITAFASDYSKTTV